MRDREFSSLSPETPRRGGRMEEGLGRDERFSGLLLTPSYSSTTTKEGLVCKTHSLGYGFLSLHTEGET